MSVQQNRGEESRTTSRKTNSETAAAAGERLPRAADALSQQFSSLDEMLDIVCKEAIRLTGATGCAILLWEDEGWPAVRRGSGEPLQALERLLVSESFTDRVIEQDKLLLLNEPDMEKQALQPNRELTALAAAPLRTNNKTIGVLAAANKEGGFTAEDRENMSQFAGQAASAIENARFYEQARQLAVLKERQRLARELHDSVTQTIYSIKLYADAARLALLADQTDTAARNLEELRSLAREAMLDMRMLIFELHPPKLEKEGLASTIQARLDAIEGRSGFQVKFYVEDERRLPAAIEEELYRIVQEALNNVTRHAQAAEVTIHLWYESNRFIMEVRDDGLGFDRAAAEQQGGMGLHSIKERVHQIGGRLTIESIPDKGTTLRVEVDI
jgi:signal transduction histidine kinase